MNSPDNRSPSFLLIRRDNIGDLVCTTPLIHALRQRFPASRICALVNSYNRAVLENNPDLDQIYTYTKAKHRAAGESAWGVYWERVRTLWRLRREGFDYVVLAAPGFQQRALQLARLIGPGHIIGFVEGSAPHAAIDMALPYVAPRPAHEVEDTFALGALLGINGAPPPVRVLANARQSEKVRNALTTAYSDRTPVIGIHISARKPSQRWPAERFAALIRAIHDKTPARFMLFWSPGAADNPLHPGDDAKAESILRAVRDLPVLPVVTGELSELIAALALSDTVICSDGGAMHLAAGLAKPILCFFGKSELARWHPWGVPYVALQPASQDVAEISVADALLAFEQLRQKTGLAAKPATGQPPVG